MLAIWVKVRIKPTMKDKFLKAIEVDALGSERDEAGCLRFNDGNPKVLLRRADEAARLAEQSHYHLVRLISQQVNIRGCDFS